MTKMTSMVSAVVLAASVAAVAWNLRGSDRPRVEATPGTDEATRLRRMLQKERQRERRLERPQFIEFIAGAR